jgi:hypothetical protein
VDNRKHAFCLDIMDGMSVRGAMAKIQEGLAELTDASLWALSDAESRELVVLAAGVRSAAEAVYLKTVLDLDTRPDAVAGARPGKVAVTFLRQRLRRSRAAADVTAAHTLEDDLPRLGDALAAGEVSREHVDVAVQTMKRIPQHLRDHKGDEIDTWVTGVSKEFAPSQTGPLARRLLEVLDPDGSDTFDPHAIDRRELTITRDATGMVLIRGQLDAGSAAPLLAAMDHLSAPWPRDDRDALPILDTRTKAQRNADALTLIARLALGAMDKGSEIDRPRVSIHAPLYGPVAECDQTGVLSKPWLQRFLCDAILEAVMIGRDGQILNLGRSVRTATKHQRRALIARDGGCVIPGCHAPGAWCDAHHATWWSKGGATDLNNLALLCGRHHGDVHSGVWALEIRDGLPWARPPTWVDPQQRWIRNTYRDHRHKGDQLGLDLEPPDDG